MDLAKLTLRIEYPTGVFLKEVRALFNPNQISIQKTSHWRLQPKPEGDTAHAQFTHGEPVTLSLDLFFDTYTYENGKDVRAYTRELFYLTTVQEHGQLHRPPLCRIEWGAFNLSDDYQCEWLLQSLSQRFTMFLKDGTPVRAVLGCTFKQWRGDEAEAKLLKRESADVAKLRIVRRGDTLSSIAAEEYEDPARWRVIAKANRIEDPRSLSEWIGQRLIIPTLREPGAEWR